MTTLAINIGPFIQKKLAKPLAKVNQVLAVANAMHAVAVKLQSFDPALNKNFPKRDEVIAQFDQDLTCKATEFKTNMMETRAKIPQPKPPVTPIVAVWPGIPGGSEGI